MARKKKEQPELRPEPKRVTPTDIQQKEFRLAFRGYNERDVDVFLDEMTEEVARLHAENKRLREEIETRSTMRGDTQAAVEADQILRQAREQASRIVAEARSQAAPPGPATAVGGRAGAGAAGSRAALRRVVARERDFLQNLATLIQDHARALKEDLAVVRSPVQAESTPADEAHPAGVEPESGPTEGRAPSSGVPSDVSSPSGEPQSDRTESESAWSTPSEAEPPPWGLQEDRPPSQPETQDIAEDSTRAWDSFLESADREEPRPAGYTPPREAPNQPFERAGLREAGPRLEDGGDEQQDRSVRELFWGED